MPIPNLKSKSKSPVHIVAVCFSCEQPSTLIVDKVHKLPQEGPPEEYTFVHCSRCSKPAVFYREDIGKGFDGESYYRVYPPQDRHIGYHLPDTVRQSYEEAVRCELARTSMACAVMVGRTLEAVCHEFDPSVRSIFDGLKSMHSKGVISDELLEWANELRSLRNLGAHATTERIDGSDATGALNFLQAILEILYDLRPKFQEFRRRRAKSKVAPQTESVKPRS
jgi:Domain of unknown function (DUF4145)